ncbi:MerR family transcriptional regulator [Pseudonocardia sp. WMMC193]|uniref:MerR family transcriptional regulator n=1 Tax=Pseudonocardia sp. WMMC193 TaxID=2911965 RepID=UPI001F000B83|nr:MerR family transcriptional regulator [Pseudonocardia sp. WMMC193]MCF7551922.1 MerR family transcriptional regulator [Pseudonocardia sp. WMMC193]
MRIGELSRLAGISTRMLRHYDAIGLVSPRQRTANGYRDYTSADVRRLFQVESLRTLGLSLQAIRESLADADVPPTALVDELIAATGERIAREQALLARLRSVRESGVTSWRDVLGLVALMQELDSPDPSRRQRAALAEGPPAPLLDALFGEQDPNVAGALRWAVVRAGDEVLPQLVAALDGPDEQARHQAVAALVRIPGAESALRRALRHRDPYVRERAALALGDRDAVPELVAMIVRGADDVSAAEALGRLARSDDPAGDWADDLAGRLVARLDDDVRARGRITQALAEIPGPAAHRALTALVADPDPAVAATARSLLARRAV